MYNRGCEYRYLVVANVVTCYLFDRIPNSEDFFDHKYRVSIKSFPDYKHLLQEYYCTWNTNIFSLSKCKSRSYFYNTLVHFNMCSFCCEENV